MTPEQLWDNHSELILAEYISKRMMSRLDFLAALNEYGEAVRAEAKKVCRDYPKRDPAEDGNGYWAAEECTAAIQKMKLP